MRDPFIASTKSNVRDAESKMVFYMFHIMEHTNRALDSVRRVDQDGGFKGDPEEDKVSMAPLLRESPDKYRQK